MATIIQPRTRPSLPIAVITSTARRVELALEHGNAEEAHSAIDDAFRVERVEISAGTSLAELDLPPRTVSILAKSEITTVGELVACSDAYLLSCRHVGPALLDQIDATLRRFGLRLARKRA